MTGTGLASLSAGVYPGSAIATFLGDANDAAAVGNGDLTIAQATPTVTWATPADITQGQALGAAQLDATASVPGTFDYSPPAGTVLPAGMGQTLTAVFIPGDAIDYNSVDASTTLNVLTSSQTPTTLAVTPVAGTYGSTATFAATLTAAGAPLGGEPVTFTITVGGQTTTLGTATTDASGVASLSDVSLGALPAGTYPGAVSASFGGDASDAASTGSGDLSIAQATPTVTWATPADITQGQALGAAQLDAKASVPGTFAYSPPAGTVLAAGVYQSLTVVFTPTDNTDYKSVDGNTSLSVLPKSATLTVMPVVGTYETTASFAATLTAAGSPLVGEPVTFTITVGGQTATLGTATTDASGVASLSGVSLTSVSAGVYPGAVIATFGGDSGIVSSGDLSIAQATPTVTWAVPADVTQGQALGAAQLDATASVPGTFAYSPPAGTVLPAGIVQTLTAVFTPADTTDYKSVSVSTTLNVLKPSTSSNVTLTSIRGAKVRIGTGRKAKKATAVVLQFSGALNSTTAQNPAAYSLLAGTIKKHVLSFRKPVPLASAIYSPSALTVTLLPQGKRKLPKYEQLTIAAGLLTDSLGRPIDGGHNVVATVSKSGLVISISDVSAAGLPKPAVVDALFDGVPGLSVRDAARRFGARGSRGD